MEQRFSYAVHPCEGCSCFCLALHSESKPCSTVYLSQSWDWNTGWCFCSIIPWWIPQLPSTPWPQGCLVPVKSWSSDFISFHWVSVLFLISTADLLHSVASFSFGEFIWGCFAAGDSARHVWRCDFSFDFAFLGEVNCKSRWAECHDRIWNRCIQLCSESMEISLQIRLSVRLDSSCRQWTQMKGVQYLTTSTFLDLTKWLSGWLSEIIWFIITLARWLQDGVILHFLFQLFVPAWVPQRSSLCELTSSCQVAPNTTYFTASCWYG